MTRVGDDATSGLDEQIVRTIEGVTAELWVLTVVFFVGGDLLTTGLGLSVGGVAEVGPLVGPLIDAYGVGAMLPLKAAAVCVCYLLWRATPSPHAVGVPLGLAVFGVLVTGWNVGVVVVSLLG